jgi:hypothetical protein
MKKQTYIPINCFYIRVTKAEKGNEERTLLIAQGANGQEYTFGYYDGFRGEHDDLIINKK